MAFVNIGHKVYLDSTEILMVIPSSGGASRSIRRQARETGKMYSACVGEQAKSIIICKNGNVISSILPASTMAGRINRGEYEVLARLTIRYSQLERKDDRMVLGPLNAEYKNDRAVLRPLTADELVDDDEDFEPDIPYVMDALEIDNGPEYDNESDNENGDDE